MHKTREDLRKRSEPLRKTPEYLRKLSEYLRKTPEYLRKLSEYLRKTPEPLRKTPEYLRKTPEYLRKLSEYLRILRFFSPLFGPSALLARAPDGFHRTSGDQTAGSAGVRAVERLFGTKMLKKFLDPTKVASGNAR